MNYNFWGLDITMCFGKDCPIKNDWRIFKQKRKLGMGIYWDGRLVWQ